MKKFTVFLSGLFISIGIQAQELFIYDSTIPPDLLPSSVTAASDSAYAGSVNLSVLSSDLIALTVPGHETAYFNAIEKDAGKWIGNKTDNKGDIVLIVNRNKIAGTITIGLTTYQICSVSDETTALIKVNHGKYLEYDIAVGLQHTPTTLSAQSPGSTEEKLRILVAYTPGAAQYATPDIMSRVRLAIEETNKTFINSEVSHRIELAACLPVNYTSSGEFTKDVSHFAQKDGIMDEVHLFRDKYSADICVLFTDPGGMGCGAPLQLLADSKTAFCVVRADCATGNYSFAQMLGYLIGAGDNKNNISFSYGQGYISWNKKWKTILAYDNDLPRVNYWSNTTVNLAADNDNRMGWVNIEDNARVLNERMNIAKGFRTTPHYILLNSLPSGAPFYFEAPAEDSIRTEEMMEIPEKSELHLRAGNKIILTPGFHAQIGSCFSASLSALSATPFGLRSVTGMEETRDTEEKTEATIALTPNPVITEGNLYYRLPENQRISIFISNSSGICVKRLYNHRLQEQGEHHISFNRSGLPAGSYFITLVAGNTVSVIKAVFL